MRRLKNWKGDFRWKIFYLANVDSILSLYMYSLYVGTCTSVWETFVAIYFLSNNWYTSILVRTTLYLYVLVGTYAYFIQNKMLTPRLASQFLFKTLFLRQPNDKLHISKRHDSRCMVSTCGFGFVWKNCLIWLAIQTNFELHSCKAFSRACGHLIFNFNRVSNFILGATIYSYYSACCIVGNH